MNVLNLTFSILPKNFCKTENMSGAFDVDKDGNLVFHQNQNSESDEFQQFQKQFNSSMQWGVALSVVSGLVATIAIVAIVYAIIDCLKKTGSAIPAYARIANGYSSIDKSSNANHSSDDVAIDLTPELQRVRSSQVEFPTVRGFLSNMAREKPALSFCGIEEQDREKAERIIMVALLCIQHSPETRPLMSNVVQMLEGDKEIASPPSPFQHLQSPQGNLTQDSGTDEDLSSSASGTKTSEQSERHSNTAVQNKCEIELAAV
ncbi:unnamed protein product [Malus baccata var. baccata]